MDSNSNYCSDKATPCGSNFYYSILFENDEAKATLIPLFALHNEFIDCLTASPDPGVIRLKFNWWHEELSRLSDHVPRHPVTQSILQLSHTNSDLIPMLHEHLVTIESIIAANHQDWIGHNFNHLGNFWTALNIFEETGVSEVITQNGSFVFGLDLISLYPLFANNAPGFISNDLLSNHKTSENKILYPEVFNELVSNCQTNLSQLYQKMKQTNQDIAWFNLILNRLSVATCEEILHDGNRVMEHRIHLTPIRKFWISCKTRLGI